MDNVKNICNVCHQPVSGKDFFCPNCGNNLKEKEMPISGIVQTGLYALAIFLPPMGLWPGIKYMMKKSKYAKRVGLITVILTLISSILNIWSIFVMFGTYMDQINGLMIGI